MQQPWSAGRTARGTAVLYDGCRVSRCDHVETQLVTIALQKCSELLRIMCTVQRRTAYLVGLPCGRQGRRLTPAPLPQSVMSGSAQSKLSKVEGGKPLAVGPKVSSRGSPSVPGHVAGPALKFCSPAPDWCHGLNSGLAKLLSVCS